MNESAMNTAHAMNNTLRNVAAAEAVTSRPGDEPGVFFGPVDPPSDDEASDDDCDDCPQRHVIHIVQEAQFFLGGWVNFFLGSVAGGLVIGPLAAIVGYLFGSCPCGPACPCGR